MKLPTNWLPISINFAIAGIYFVAIQFAFGVMLTVMLRLQGKTSFEAISALESVETFSVGFSILVILILWWKYHPSFFLDFKTKKTQTNF